MKELKSAVKILKIIKISIEVLIIAIIIIVILLSAAHIFMMFKGKSILIQKLSDLTDRNVSIGYFTVTPLFNLEIKNLNIEGLAEVENLYLSPSLLYLLTGRIALNKVIITRPQVTYERIPPQAKEASRITPEESAKPLPSPAPSAAEVAPATLPVNLILRHLVIQDGRINFIDHTVGPEGIRLTVKGINFKLTSSAGVLPISKITNFELKGRIPWREGEEEGKIEAEGWLNFSKKDMQATVKVLDIDGIYFYPYYSQWVDLEKARIEKAKLNFESDIQGLNNNVTADCHLELTDIVRKARSPEESVDKAERIADTILDIFKAMNQGKIVLDFTIRTKMDRPHFGFGNLKSAVEDKLAASQQKSDKFRPQDILMLPGKIIEGTLKGTGDLTKSVITGTVEAGKTVIDTIKKR